VIWAWWEGAAAAAPYYVLPFGALIFGSPRPNLKEYRPLPPESQPLVSIIIPARNEAGNIARCLRSILAGDYQKIQVICVDDRSDDGTLEAAEAVAADDARLTVVQGAMLPDGWYGKPWACWQGTQFATATILLFTDADTVHGPHLLSRAVAALETERADLVTVMPRQEMAGFWERLVQPFFFLLLGLRFGSLKRLNRNRNPRHAIANGQFILTWREAYEWVGGHRKVSGTVIEDLMLAVEYTKASRKLHFALADEDMTTRMYDSLGAIVEGWSKNFFRGVMQTFEAKPLAYAAALLTLLFPAAFILPVVMLVRGLMIHSKAEVAFGGLAYGGATLLMATILRASKAPMIYAIFHPLGALVTARILLRAIWRGTGLIEWKGRRYSHA
jgi:chlorobactene glucosyltransferase